MSRCTATPRRSARRIAAALREQGLEVEASLVSKIDPEQTTEVDLLVVGGPTHVHGLSRDSTRKTAAADEKNTFPEPTLEPGLRSWLARLPKGAGRVAAAFDTRIDKPLILTGSAGKGIGHRLEGRGFRLVTEPECFLVSTQNRLLDGELKHAATWGKKIAEQVGIGEAVASR
jgi:hypothetical protein